MTAVLLALGPRLDSAALVEDVRRLAATGQTVHLLSWVAPSTELAAACTETTVLGPQARGAMPVPAAEASVPSELAEVDPVDLVGAESVDASAVAVTQGDMAQAAEDAVAAAADAVDDSVDDSVEERPAAAGSGATGLPRALEVAGRVARTPGPYARRVRTLAGRRARRVVRVTRRGRRQVNRTLGRRVRGRMQRPKSTRVLFSDPQRRQLLRRADILVALDATSVLAVWVALRGRGDATGVVGLAAAVSAAERAPTPSS